MTRTIFVFLIIILCTSQSSLQRLEKNQQLCESCLKIVGQVYEQIPKLANNTVNGAMHAVETFCNTRLSKFQIIQDICVRIDKDILNPVNKFIADTMAKADPNDLCRCIKIC